MLIILWKSGSSKGYRDLYPSRWLADDGTSARRDHDVQGPRGGRYHARCTVRIHGSIVDFDYGGEHARFNEKHHHIGILRIVFTDTTRTKVEEVRWREDGTKGFVVEDVDAFALEVPLEGLDDFDPTDLKDGRRKIQQMVVLRHGQPKFRSALMDAYEGRCVISGCDVREVLEAAHIMPYLGDETNEVSNGLLLRADLHTLFDVGLLKVSSDYSISAEPHIVDAFSLPAELMYLPIEGHLRPSTKALSRKWE